jgi:hypothetical protein
MREPGLPVALDDWFERALAKDPARRFQSAKEAGQAFERALGERSSSPFDLRASSPDYATSPTVTAQRVDGELDEVGTRNSSTRVAVARHSVSNDTVAIGLPGVLAQLAELSGVLGAALVDPARCTIAHHGSAELPPSLFGELAERVDEGLRAFENVEAARGRLLALYFQSATVLVRWIEGYALVVVGTEQVHPAVLSVSLNNAAAKLQASTEQAGGAENAFRIRSSEPAPTPAAVSGIPPAPASPLHQRTYRGARFR